MLSLWKFFSNKNWSTFSLLLVAIVMGSVVNWYGGQSSNSFAAQVGIFDGEQDLENNPVPAPTVTLSASPTTVNAGGNVTLLWTSTNATSLSINNGIGAVSGPNGSMVVNPTVTSTYTITATNDSGSTSANATVTIGTINKPTVNLSTTYSTITLGQSVTLSWTSSEADELILNEGIGVVTGPNGNRTVSPKTTTTYTISATNEGGVSTDSVTITVQTLARPAVTLGASDTSIFPGQSVTLNWTSQRATTLTINQGIGAVTRPKGNRVVNPNSTTTYTLTGTNASGSDTDSVTITVSAPPPTLSFSANPESITQGSSATLTWSSTNATSVNLQPGNQFLSNSGSIQVTPNSSTNYTLVAQGAGGSITRSVTVNVSAPIIPPDEPVENPSNIPLENPSNPENTTSTAANGNVPATTSTNTGPNNEDTAKNSNTGNSASNGSSGSTSIPPLPKDFVASTGSFVTLNQINGRNVSEVQNNNTRNNSADNVVDTRPKVLYGLPVSETAAESPAVKALVAVENFRTAPETQAVSYAALAPASVAVTVAATSATVAATQSAGILLYAQAVIGQLITFSGRRRDKNKGQVLNSLNGQPISLAIVRLYDNKVNRLLQTQVTDKLGQYQFVIGPGSYRIQVSKEGFDFPATLGDTPANYHLIENTLPKATIKIPLNMDPAAELSTFSASRLLAVKSKQKVQKILVLIGFIMALASFVLLPNWFTGIILASEIVMFSIINLYHPKKLATQEFGSVVDSNKQPISKAIIRLLDPKYHRMLSFEVADTQGRYSFLVDNQERLYELMAEKTGYKTAIIKDVKPLPGKNLIAANITLPPEVKNSPTKGSENQIQTINVEAKDIPYDLGKINLNK